MVLDLPEHLVANSCFTSAQLESLQAYRQVISGNLTLNEAANMRKRGPVKIGSFYRTVQQGRRNIRESVVTLIIAIWIGMIKPSEINRLLNQVGKPLPDLGGYDTERLAAVIEDIANNIVM
jgi:hypothetical protein